MPEKKQFDGVMHSSDGVSICTYVDSQVERISVLIQEMDKRYCAVVAEREKTLDKLMAEADRRYEQRFEAQKMATEAALASAQLAVDKAEKNTEKWQANANEWRGAMNDRERSLAEANLRRENLFLLKGEYTVAHDNIVQRVDLLESLRDVAEGKASRTAVIITGVIGGLGLVMGVIDFVIKISK